MAAAQKPKHERLTSLGGAKLQIDQEIEFDIHSVYDYYFGLRVLANAYALAGNYKVESRFAPGSR